MELVMTLVTEDHRFPLSGDHDLFPSFFSLHVLELSDVMDFEESPFFSTKPADVCFQTLL
jgi:hypothetical protein